jgi:Protein of unknown function (DUF1214)
MADAWKAYEEAENKMHTGELTSADVFGTRAYLKNNYRYRMVGAVDGIYGNSKEEAIYPRYTIDSTGQRVDASKHRYTLRFAPGQLPPVNAFWSLTMYELPLKTARREPAGPLSDQFPDAAEPETRRRWRRDALHSARVTWSGQENQLAAGTKRPVHHGAASVLAQA